MLNFNKRTTIDAYPLPLLNSRLPVRILAASTFRKLQPTTQDQEWGCNNVHECFWPDRCSQLLTSNVHGHMCSYDKWISISTAAIVWLAKLPTTILTSMINEPFGRQWKLIAVNVLVVSRSLNNNIFLLVMQDYHKIS